jgi:hypothetical protein
MGGNAGAENANLMANSKNAQRLSGLYNGNASAIKNTLSPELQAESATPMGYSPSQMASQTTAAEQTAGGGAAGATGGAMLRAARSGNVGAAQPAISQASRNASQNLSQTNADINTNSANLGAKRQMSAQSGLEDLYGTNVNAGENALNISNTANQDAANIKPFWQTMLLQGMQSAGQAAGGGSFGTLGCWIAAELYGGWDDPRTIAVRKWIFTDFAKSRFERMVCALYLKFGKQMAEQIRKHPILRKPFLALFNRALRKAEQEAS